MVVKKKSELYLYIERNTIYMCEKKVYVEISICKNMYRRKHLYVYKVKIITYNDEKCIPNF